jgi:hypothetical protein
MASVALSTMWMRFPRFVVAAVDAEKLRVLRLAKAREPKAGAS